jgi:Rrf2 family protein
MLSQKCRYALSALIELARAGDDRQLTAGEIALRADLPRKFLEAILLELSRRRLIISRRGKFGGYALARPAAEISFAEVVRGIDGPLALAPCASQTAFRKCDTCESLETCSMRPAWIAARDATAAALEAYTLAHAASHAGPAKMAEVIGVA